MDGVWLTGTPLPVARTAFGCAAIGKKIYCIGGSTINWMSGYLNTVLIYDTETGISSYGANIPTARTAFGCIEIDKKIYCFGGYNGSALKSLEIYDILTDSWSVGSPMPMALRHFGFAEANGEIYAFNGSTHSAILQKTYKYNPGLDSWSEAATCAVDAILSAASTEGKIYATGGNNQRGSMFNKKLFIYNSLTDVWAERAEMDAGSTGPTTVIFKGKFCCISGMQANTGAGSSTIHDEMRIYDIARDSWSYGPPLLTARYDSHGVVVDNKIYCIGGDNNSGKAYTTVEIFTIEDEKPEGPANDCCCCTKVEIKISTCSKNQDLLDDINHALTRDGKKKDCNCCKVVCCN